jgi:hypothetical protein
LGQDRLEGFPPVSASLRHAERRKPAAGVHAEIIDIVDEFRTADGRRGFPPFPPFPPAIFGLGRNFWYFR